MSEKVKTFVDWMDELPESTGTETLGWGYTVGGKTLNQPLYVAAQEYGDYRAEAETAAYRELLRDCLAYVEGTILYCGDHAGDKDLQQRIKSALTPTTAKATEDTE